MTFLRACKDANFDKKTGKWKVQGISFDPKTGKSARYVDYYTEEEYDAECDRRDKLEILQRAKDAALKESSEQAEERIKAAMDAFTKKCASMKSTLHDEDYTSFYATIHKDVLKVEKIFLSEPTLEYMASYEENKFGYLREKLKQEALRIAVGKDITLQHVVAYGGPGHDYYWTTVFDRDVNKFRGTDGYFTTREKLREALEHVKKTELKRLEEQIAKKQAAYAKWQF